MNLMKIFLAAMLIDNVVLMRFLALCPFIGMSVDVSKSVGMGLAVTFVTVIATVVTFPLYAFVLVPLNLSFLQILVFILVIASLVQLVEFFLKMRRRNCTSEYLRHLHQGMRRIGNFNIHLYWSKSEKYDTNS